MLRQDAPVEPLDATVAIVADAVIQEHHDYASAYDRTLEMTEERHITELAEALRTFARDVRIFRTPAELIDAIAGLTTAIVIPNWGGRPSRNRYAYVPAICEAYGIRYVGGDAYTKIVCQDKKLAKELIRRAGLAAPQDIVLSRPDALVPIEHLRLPLVVKPTLEGSSLGLACDDLYDSYDDARRRAEELLAEFRQPILVEEFTRGAEVSICLLGSADEIVLLEAAERFVIDDDRYLFDHVFGFELKVRKDRPTAMRLVTGQISVDVLRSCRELFRSLDKVDFVRIDGRLDSDLFTVIELTPDTHIGKRAEFFSTFIQAGFSYELVLRELLRLAERPSRSSGASTTRTQGSSQTGLGM